MQIAIEMQTSLINLKKSSQQINKERFRKLFLQILKKLLLLQSFGDKQQYSTYNSFWAAREKRAIAVVGESCNKNPFYFAIFLDKLTPTIASGELLWKRELCLTSQKGNWNGNAHKQIKYAMKLSVAIN